MNKKRTHVPVINITTFANQMGLPYEYVVVTEPLWDAMVKRARPETTFHDVFSIMLSTLARTIEQVGVENCHIVGVEEGGLFSVAVRFEKGRLHLDLIPPA
jgi:hypothetical protein